MKWNCGPTKAEKAAAQEKWHLWFAWFPVRAGRERRWLETVARKGKCYYGGTAGYWWVWEYK